MLKVTKVQSLYDNQIVFTNHTINGTQKFEEVHQKVANLMAKKTTAVRNIVAKAEQIYATHTSQDSTTVKPAYNDAFSRNPAPNMAFAPQFKTNVSFDSATVFLPEEVIRGGRAASVFPQELLLADAKEVLNLKRKTQENEGK